MRIGVVAIVVVGVSGCALVHERAAGGLDAAAPDGGADAWLEPPPPIDAWTPPPIDAWMPDAAVPEQPNGGVVYVEHVDDMVGLSLWAYFTPMPLSEMRRGRWSPDCTVAQSNGICHLVSCPNADHASDDAESVTLHVGGTVALASSMLQPMTGLFAGAWFDGYSVESPTMSISPGDALAVFGGSPAARVPVFSTELVAPPHWVGALPTQISRSRDLTITWSSAVTHVTIVLGPQTLPPVTRPSILCRLGGAPGSVTIPASMLASFSVGDRLFLDALAMDLRTVVAPPYAIDVYAGNVAVSEPTIVP